VGRGVGSSLGAEVEEQLLEATAAAAVAALSHPPSSAVAAADSDDSSSSLPAAITSHQPAAAAAAVGAPGAAYAALLSSIPWLVRALLEHGCYSSCKDVARAAACNSRQGLLLPLRSSRKQRIHATAGTHTTSTSSRTGESSSCCSAEVLGQMLQQVLQWEGCTAAAGGEVKAVQQVVEAVAEGLFQGCSVEECLVVLGHLAPVLGAKVAKRVGGAAAGRLYSVRRQVELILEGLE